MIRIYTNTRLGKMIARSVKMPNTPAYKIVSHLDKLGHQTVDQISSYTGMTEADTMRTLSALEHKKIVTRVG